MGGRTRIGAAMLFALVVCAATGASAHGASGLPSRSDLQESRQVYLDIAQRGLAATEQRWWNSDLGWYNDFLYDADNHMRLARLWSVYPLFETLAAVAVAQPTAANKAALRRFADKAAVLYWNPNLVPVGGYEWYPGLNKKISTAYFDDSAWWGLAFIDAYRATGDTKYLEAAHRAFRFIVIAGWDAKRGGVWWETEHRHKTAEPLAAAVLIGTWLYKVRHKPWYLTQVNKLLRWADVHSFNKQRGLYQRSATDSTVMDYVQGMMIAAHAELCRIRHQPALCTKAKQLADAAERAFPQDLDWTPSTDVVYIRWMLDYYRQTGDKRWYELAYHNAQRALLHAQDSRGLWVNDWNGKWISDGLQHHAANLELFAWTAALPVPKS